MIDLQLLDIQHSRRWKHLQSYASVAVAVVDVTETHFVM
jgi:hypothetical protein